MAAGARTTRTANRWAMWLFWAAGVALLLVEINAANEYLKAGLQHNMGNLLGWAPAMAMITLRLVGQSLWHWGTLAVALEALPVAALGLLLVGIGLAIHAPAGIAQAKAQGNH